MSNLDSATSGPSSSLQLLKLQSELIKSECFAETTSQKINDVCLYILTDKNNNESLEVEVRRGASFQHPTGKNESSDIKEVATKILNLYKDYKKLPKEQQKSLEVLKENLYKIIENYNKEVSTDATPELKQKIAELKKIQKEFHSIQKEESLIAELKKTPDTDTETIKRLLNQMSYPIHGAILSGKATKDMVASLIAEGADPNATDEEGNTPLHCAYDTNLEILLVLTEIRDFDLNIRDSSGNTLLHRAYHDNNEELLFNLIEKPRVDPNATDSSGMTLLHHAFKDGRSDIAETLMEKRNCDLTATDESGKTPTQYLLVRSNEQTSNDLQQEVQQMETSQQKTELEQLSATETETSTPAKPKDVTPPKETSKLPAQSINYQNWHKSTKSSIAFAQQEDFRKLLTTKTTKPETMIKFLVDLSKHELYPKDAQFLASTFVTTKSTQIPDVFKQLPFLVQLHVRECMLERKDQIAFTKQLEKNAERLQIEELETALEYLNNSLSSAGQKTNLPDSIQVLHRSLQATLTKIKEQQTLTKSSVDEQVQPAQEKREVSPQQKTIGHADKRAPTPTRTPPPTTRQSRLTTTPLTPITTRADSTAAHSRQTVKSPMQKRAVSPQHRPIKPLEPKQAATPTRNLSPTTRSPRPATQPLPQSQRTTRPAEKTVSPKESVVSANVSKNYQTWNQRSDDNLIKEEMLNNAYTTERGSNAKELLQLNSIIELCPADATRVAEFLKKNGPTMNSLRVFSSFLPLDQLHILESISNEEQQKIFKDYLIQTLKTSKEDLTVLFTYLNDTIKTAKNPSIQPIPILKEVYEKLNATL